MLGLVAEISQIELVDNEGWLEQIAGPAMIAIAAIIAAALAAWVAIRNTQHQLDHDQRVRNREHIRDAIDEAAAAFEAAFTGSDKLFSHVWALEMIRKTGRGAGTRGEGTLQPNNWQEAEQQTVEEGQAAREEAFAGVFRMEGAIGRLELRLDKEDPLITSYRGLHDALLELVTRMSRGLNDNRILDPRVDEEKREAVVSQFAAFRKASYSWFNE